MLWAETLLDGMWRSAVAVVPLALLVALVCSRLRHRPGTRHALWLAALLGLVVLPFLPVSRVMPPNVVGWVEDDALTGNLVDDREPGAVGGFPVVLDGGGMPDGLAFGGGELLGGVAELPLPHGRGSDLPRACARGSDGFDSLGVDGDLIAGDADGLSAVVGRALATLLRLAGTPDGGERSTAATTTGADDVADSPEKPHERGFSRAIDRPRAVEKEHLRAASITSETSTISSTLGTSSASIKSGSSPTNNPRTTPDRLPVPASSPVVDSPSTQERAAPVIETWRNWVGQLAAARDALGAVSPIPVSLWLCGAVVFALVQCVLAFRLSRQLAAAVAAPRDIERLVASVARALRLRRVPACVIVQGRLSPMIWCGWRKRLVLPADLWAELDEDGRHAVVTHELAHLRRRDHWVRWIEVVIGCVYWWHPVVWWVRSRLNAEAEVCCDAWVTWLHPRKRRAYAAALLTARQYVSTDTHAAPAVGIGAGTRKTKTFARRLTMIMTRKDAPGLSLTGLVLAAVIVLTGWVATPARSDDAEVASAGESVTIVATDGGVFTVAAAPTVVASGEEPAFVYTVSSPGDDDDDDDLEDRLDRLEQQMSKLMAIMGERRGGGPFPKRVARQAPHVACPPHPRAAPHPPHAPAHVDQDGTYAHAYRLSGGKLKALTTLMSRDDVPVLISPGKDAITVHGTAAQHAVFARFVGVIGDEERRTHELSGGKLQALVNLMIRDDVPVRVTPGDDDIGVIGSPAQQQIVADFIKLISGEQVRFPRATRKLRDRDVRLSPETFQRFFDPARKAEKLAQKEFFAQVRDAHRAEQTELRERLRGVRDQSRLIHRERDSLERQAGRLREEAERMQEEAERMHEAAERLRERVGSDVEHEYEREALLSQYVEVRTAAGEFESALAAMRAEAEAQSAHAQAMEYQIQALEEQADMLEERADELEAAESDDAESENRTY